MGTIHEFQNSLAEPLELFCVHVFAQISSSHQQEDRLFSTLGENQYFSGQPTHIYKRRRNIFLEHDSLRYWIEYSLDHDILRYLIEYFFLEQDSLRYFMNIKLKTVFKDSHPTLTMDFTINLRTFFLIISLS